MNQPQITNLKNKRVLVTGGGGFLGKAIINHLLAFTPFVCSLSRQYYPELEQLKVQQIQGDLSNADIVNQACQKQDIVLHVAAKTGGMWGSVDQFHATNVVGTQNVIDACLHHGVTYLIHTSSPSVIYDGDADLEGVDESLPYPKTYRTAYQLTKAEAEQLVVQACDQDLQAIILRPHLIWGPGDTHFAPRIIERANMLRRVGNGKNRIDVTYIDNAAQAHILAADKLINNSALSGRIYFISNGEPIYLWDMVNHILNAAGLPPVKKSIPKAVAYFMGALMEWVYTGLRIRSEPKMTRFLANELSRSHWFDISAARQDLGYVPEVSLEEGLKRLKEWMEPCN
jgi:nucleoside-diphosphate-sugar epimerase